MKKSQNIIFGVFLLIALSGIVYAANKEGAAAGTAEGSSKDMTYGQCVSQNAEIKNSCYASVKATLSTCKEQAAQDTAEDDAIAQCKSAYKKDKKQCKVAFKSSKKECAKIKHNFIETLGSSFK